LRRTPEEIVDALFDNASRRQMTEAERKAKIRKRKGQNASSRNASYRRSMPLQGREDRQEIDR